MKGSRCGIAAALLLVASAGPAVAAPPEGTRALAVGGFIGFESGDLDGFDLRLDGELPLQALSPQIDLSGVASLGFWRSSKDIAYGDVKMTILKLIPAARFTLPASPQLSLYGDAGLGLYRASFESRETIPLFGVHEQEWDEVSLLLRLGAGGFFQVNPKVRLAVEFDLTPYLGDVDATTWALLIGAMVDL